MRMLETALGEGLHMESAEPFVHVERLVAEHEERLEKEKTLVEFSSRVAEESER